MISPVPIIVIIIMIPSSLSSCHFYKNDHCFQIYPHHFQHILRPCLHRHHHHQHHHHHHIIKLTRSSSMSHLLPTSMTWEKKRFWGWKKNNIYIENESEGRAKTFHCTYIIRILVSKSVRIGKWNVKNRHLCVVPTICLDLGAPGFSLIRNHFIFLTKENVEQTSGW